MDERFNCKTFDLVVRTLVGTEFVVEDLCPNDSVKMLKLAIQDSHGIKCSSQSLMYGRTLLDDDDKELQEYGIRDQDATLTLVTAMRGGPLNARRAASASSIEPDTEIVLELLDGNDVIGSITLDEDLFDMLPGAEGKQFFVYFPGEEADMQRMAYMDFDEYNPYGHLVGDADSPLFGDGDVANPAGSSPMCSSRPRTRSYSSMKLRRHQEERYDMECKVEQLRAQMSNARNNKVKKPVPAKAKKPEKTEYERPASVADPTSPLPTVANAAAGVTGSQTPIPGFHARDGFSRARGPTPRRAYLTSPQLEQLELERPLLDSHASKPFLVSSTAFPNGSAARSTAAVGEDAVTTGPLVRGAMAAVPASCATTRRNSRDTLTDVEYLQQTSRAPQAKMAAGPSLPPLTKQTSHLDSVTKRDVSMLSTNAASYDQATSNLLQTRKGTLANRPSLEHNPCAPRLPYANRHEGRGLLPRSAVLPSSTSSKHPGQMHPAFTESRAPLACEAAAMSFLPAAGPINRITAGEHNMAKDRRRSIHRAPDVPADSVPLSLPPIHPSRVGQYNTSNPSLVPATATAQQPKVEVVPVKAAKEGRAGRQRCSQCNKKMSLAGTFTCRCGLVLCTKHRNPETHPCSYDYKTEGRRELKDGNPRVQALKLPKI